MAQTLRMTRMRSERLSFMAPGHLAAWLYRQASEQGRSTSNLCAFLLEAMMREDEAKRADSVKEG